MTDIDSEWNRSINEKIIVIMIILSDKTVSKLNGTNNLGTQDKSKTSFTGKTVFRIALVVVADVWATHSGPYDRDNNSGNTTDSLTRSGRFYLSMHSIQSARLLEP